MIEKDVVNVCFCADGIYKDFIPPAIESIIDSAHVDSIFCFDLILDQYPNAALLERLNMIAYGNYNIYVINVDEFSDLIEVTHISRAMYYRLLIPETLPHDRVLYLDCDVIVRGDISSLYNTDMEGKGVAAVVNPFFDASHIGFAQGDRYFNSGVMLIDRSYWIEKKVKENTLRYLRSNVLSLKMPDQDALNIIFGHMWKELHPRYNCQVSMLVRYKELNVELGMDRSIGFLNDPTIMHFTAAHKQWHISNRIVYAKEYQLLRTAIFRVKRNWFLDRLSGYYRKLKYNTFLSNPYFF